jgi:hypothetical protein
MIKLEKNKLEEIIDDLECPEDFKCYKSNFNDLCEMEDLGMDSFVLCLDKKSKWCTFSISFGDSKYCKCPLRVYIAKELKK